MLVAYSRFVAPSQHAMMRCHGGGHPGKVRTKTAEATAKAGLDAGSTCGAPESKTAREGLNWRQIGVYSRLPEGENGLNYAIRHGSGAFHLGKLFLLRTQGVQEIPPGP